MAFSFSAFFKWAVLFGFMHLTTPSFESLDPVKLLEQDIHAACQNQDKIDNGFHCVFEKETRLMKLDGFEPESLTRRAIGSLSLFGCGRLVRVRFPLHGQHYVFYFVGILGGWFPVHSHIDSDSPMEQHSQYEHAHTPTTYKYRAPSAVQDKTTHTNTLSA